MIIKSISCRDPYLIFQSYYISNADEMNCPRALLYALLASLCHGFSSNHPFRHHPTTILMSRTTVSSLTSSTTALQAQKQPAPQSSSSSSSSSSSRTDFLQASFSAVTAAAATALLPKSLPAVAAADPTLKGTKKDPAYESCVGKCMYECTKPKGAEQKTRMECLPGCKKQCATTAQQLLVGTPLNKE